jgi:hypothetical protein
MKRATLLLTALFLAGPALFADDTRPGGDPENKPVIVDPLDLRQPVPDPEKGLTEKYDGKTVRHVGELTRWGQDNQTKTYWYELQTVIAKPKPVGQAKQDPKAKPDIVTVKVYFADDEKQLRAKNARFKVKVEGKGEITADGSLVIQKARLVDMDTLPKR